MYNKEPHGPIHGCTAYIQIHLQHTRTQHLTAHVPCRNHTLHIYRYMPIMYMYIYMYIFTYIHAYQARLKYFHAQSTGAWKQVHMFYTHHDIDMKIYVSRIMNMTNT